MAKLRVGCQTYTWEMLGERFVGGPQAIVEAIAAAGYGGIEITDAMIGSYADRPAEFAAALRSAGLELVAFTFSPPSGFTVRERFDEDLAIARRWIDFTAAFPGALACMGSATEVTGGERAEKFAVAAKIHNRIAAMARTAGIDVAVHPSSHHNTLLFDRADYDRLFALLDPQIGWVPDTGHLLRGGHDLADTLAAYRDRIRYVHLKDVDAAGAWTMLGQGVCDIGAVLGAVTDAPTFNGWIVIEEESGQAAADPAAAVKTNRATMRVYGL